MPSKQPTTTKKEKSSLKKKKQHSTSWVKAIPHNTKSHGSGTLQKKLWKLVSDYTRIRDWYTYDGRCVATGTYIEHWSLSDPGHYISYSVCNGLFKFDIWNVHLQSKSSNGWGGQAIGHDFGEELKRRYGDTFLDELKAENRAHIGEKLSNDLIIKEMEEIIELFESLPETPEYIKRVWMIKEGQ